MNKLNKLFFLGFVFLTNNNPCHSTAEERFSFVYEDFLETCAYDNISKNSTNHSNTNTNDNISTEILNTSYDQKINNNNFVILNHPKMRLNLVLNKIKDFLIKIKDSDALTKFIQFIKNSDKIIINYFVEEINKIKGINSETQESTPSNSKTQESTSSIIEEIIESDKGTKIYNSNNPDLYEPDLYKSDIEKNSNSSIFSCEEEPIESKKKI